MCAFFAGPSYSVYFATLATTDDHGEVSVQIQPGVIVGVGAIEIRLADDDSHIETVSVITQPGQPALIAAVQDTAVYAGRSYSLRMQVTDRVNNPLSIPVTATSLTPSVTSVSGPLVTAIAVGRARLELTGGGVMDTVFASVPPPGRMVAFGWAPDGSIVNQMMLISTDGSGRKLLLLTQGGSAVWTPDGSGIIFASGNDPRSLIHIDTAGNHRTFLSNQATFSNAFQPAVSSSLVYFFGMKPDGSSGVYTAQLDGTGSAPLFPGVQPAPSPTGSHVAYIRDVDLIVRTISSGDTVTIATGARLPRWSPAGDEIGFLQGDAVRVIDADGANLRSLGTAIYAAPIGFSPTGEWLAVGRYSGGIDLIRVSDGLVLPIASTRDLSGPSWRP